MCSVRGSLNYIYNNDNKLITVMCNIKYSIVSLGPTIYKSKIGTNDYCTNDFLIIVNQRFIGLVTNGFVSNDFLTNGFSTNDFLINGFSTNDFLTNGFSINDFPMYIPTICMSTNDLYIVNQRFVFNQ